MSILANKMKLELRDRVFEAIEGERDFQDHMSTTGLRPDIRTEFAMGDILGAIQVNLARAQEAWYLDVAPDYVKTMPYLRRIAALCVKAGEVCGMPHRPLPCDVSFRSFFARKGDGSGKAG